MPEAARRVQRNPETIRRWIRSGRLPARKIGTQHIIEERGLLDLVDAGMLPLPPGWERTVSGAPMPNVIAHLRRSRGGR